MLHLGKKPANPVRPKLKLAKYLNLSVLPSPPRRFGHEELVSQPWMMLGNDSVGNCVEAGAAHETMVWNAEAGRQVTFSAATVISDYSRATGYDPHRPWTDVGTDMTAYAKYRRNLGVLDVSGNRHKIGAYADLQPGNIEELLTAMYLFGAVGVGIQFPQSAMDQFNAGEPWLVVPGSPIIGGHYIPAVRRLRHESWWRTRILTWGAWVHASDAFIETYCDEAIAYISLESLTDGKSIEGFDKEHLLADLAAFTA